MNPPRVIGWTARSAAGALLVALQLACGGFGLFGPPCEPEGFGQTCYTDRSYQQCWYNEWAGEHRAATIHCDRTEKCVVADGSRPICAIDPLETCAPVSARRCVDAEVQTCGGVSDELAVKQEGQPLWLHEDFCDSSEECVQRQDWAGCVHRPVTPCSRDERRYRCEGEQPEECRGLVGPQFEGRPEFWAPILERCEADETCSTDGAMVYCVARPATSCPTLDETRCVDGRLQRCQRGAGGLMGPPTPQWTWTRQRCP